ncbi:hypothetical protein SAMN04487948_1122 [Halogranum amylolyticum]|uniref:Uncharacterized protein n=1 Tax=Halogranum amylolyticum TaxID=660520 RepID=A0A1H8UNT6_9EURY|nr:hypothetical protein SAMN04487948_1122 [Halogranum amylolyticum]
MCMFQESKLVDFCSCAETREVFDALFSLFDLISQLRCLWLFGPCKLRFQPLQAKS